MSIATHLDDIEKRIREHDMGYSYEYLDPIDNQVKIFNELDYKTGLNYKAAAEEELSDRTHNYIITITVLTLVIIVVLLVMVLIHINTITNMTGIYYDKTGNKIEVYHNKVLGSVKFLYNDGLSGKVTKEGILKKINEQQYGLYLDEDAVLGKYSLSAYVDARDKTWSWKDNKWIMD